MIARAQEFGGLRRLDRSALLWSTTTVALSILLGLGLTHSVAPLFVAVLIVVVVCIRAWPKATIVGCFALIALTRALYVDARLSVAGLPISVQDGLPLILLGGALELRSQAPTTSEIAPVLRKVLILFAAGLAVGTAVGVLDHAARYQLLRVLRVEAELMIGLFAAAIAAPHIRWREAVRVGLVVAGWVTAIQIIGSVVFALTTGRSLWSELGFSGSVDIYGQIQQGNVNILRSNDISTFLMLPALGLALVRLRRADVILAAVLLTAFVMSFSRGAWLAAILVAVLAMLYRTQQRGGQGRAIALWFVTLTAVAFLSTHYFGQLVSTRINQSSGLHDSSSSYRINETRIALRQLTRGPFTMIAGTGAGVILPIPQTQSVTSERDVASFLENSLLSRWTNLSILSFLGAILLLVASSSAAWSFRGASSGLERELGALGMCLPAILIGGVASGAAFSQGTLPFWALAGTLVGGARRSGR